MRTHTKDHYILKVERVLQKLFKETFDEEIPVDSPEFELYLTEIFKIVEIAYENGYDDGTDQATEFEEEQKKFRQSQQ